MKNHLGESHPIGARKIPVEWIEDRPFVVPIEEFDYASLDSFEDIMREKLRRTGEARLFFERCVQSRLEQERADIVRSVFSLVIGSKRPDLACYQMAFACGLLETAELTQPELAKRYGISKEAVQQGVEKFRRLLGLRQTRTMRGEAERQRMREANYRKLNGL